MGEERNCFRMNKTTNSMFKMLAYGVVLTEV